VPDFKGHDVGDRIEALGGLKVKRPMGGSASSPDLRAGISGLKPSQAMGASLLRQTGQVTPPTGPPPAAGGTWQSFLNTQGSNSLLTGTAGTLGYPPKKSLLLQALQPLPLSNCAANGREKPLPKSVPVPEENIPVVSYWNFRAMPLETFDMADDFETHTPEEWMEIVRKTPHKPQGNVVHYDRKKYNMMPCWIHEYNEKSVKYVVELEDGAQKQVKRLALCFNAEDAPEFNRRVETARARKAACELQESFIAYIDYQADECITLMTQTTREKYTRWGVAQALQAGKEVDPELPKVLEPVIRELLQEIEDTYTRSAKFFLVKVELIHDVGTNEACPIEDHEFSPLLSSFLPSPVPPLGQVSDYGRAELTAPEVIDNLCEVPTLNFSSLSVTLHVWRAYIDEHHKYRILNTTRKDSDDPSKALLSRKVQDDIDYDKRVFELHDFEKHMLDHRDFVSLHLKRKWRDYLIAEVLDKLAEEHNFFIDNDNAHKKSTLHRILRKFELMLNTQMRWFVQDSINGWRDFMQSFIPHPQRCMPAPLLILRLIPDAKNGEVLIEPDLHELEEVMIHLIDGVTHTTDDILSIEFEMVPFCSQLPHDHFWQPLMNPDHEKVDFKEMEDLKKHACAVLVECLKAPQEIQRQYQKYAYLLTDEIEDLDPTDVEGTRERVAEYMKAAREVEQLTVAVHEFPLFHLECSGIMETLSSRGNSLAKECLDGTSESISQRATDILDEWQGTHEKILSTPEDEAELAELKEFMAKVDKTVKRPLEARTKEVMEQLNMVEGFFQQVDESVVKDAFMAYSWPIQIQLDIMQAEAQLDKEKIQFMEQLDREKEEYRKNMKDWKEKVAWVKSLDDFTMCLSIESTVDKLHHDLIDGRDRVASFSEREKLFQIEQEDYDELEEVIDEFKPFHHLWHAACEYKHNEEEWTTGALTSLSAPDIEQFIDEEYKDSYKMFKAFEGQTEPQKVADSFRKEIQAFKKNMPVISALCQEAIEPVHFQQLFEEMECEPEDGDQYTLQWLLDQGVLKHIEVVETISTQAQKQYSLKQTMKTMKGEWKEMDMETLPYKETGTYLIKGTDDIQALLDDHIIKTQAVLGSPFVKPIEKEVKEWYAKLMLIQDILEQWLMVQRTWLYLEPIFGAEDIVRQMPKEAKEFQVVDTLWRNVLNSVNENPNMIDVSEIEGLLPNFIAGNKRLDVIQKSLNDYLETKRLAFPRFFFLSNDELLMILSQTKDPEAVQPHMGKCFEGINRVRFDKESVIIEAMESIEGEMVDLDKPVNVAEGDKKGNVEKWLLEVESSMIDCLIRISGDSIKTYETEKRTDWVALWPGQVIICVDMIFWTKETTDAIDKGELDIEYKKQYDQVMDLVELVRGDINKLVRKTLTAMVTIDVHNRDVVNMLKQKKLKNSADFDWMAQLRYYWAPKGSIIMYETQKPNTTDQCQVSIINSTLLYGFEYLGNSDRLVVTPLTDRCYRTLMGAFALFYGGAPEGPAGTGKTESTKDLAKALSVQCVVFNCSDGLDYLAMGKFFKGLASSGAWCCFDEFNRINLEVLSVIAAQVSTISWAIKARKKTFQFEGTEIKLIPTCAVNITMNPGYAGRSDLPDNLKALFRPCAMMVPDYALIGEIVLYSFGFGDARYLAVKAVASLRLGSEQLSSQDHYDFGMRALKSILVAAGQLRRKFGSSRPEDVLMLMALNDVNLPKFTSNDIPLFKGITGDLFPGVSMPPSDYGALLAELQGACLARNLQPKPSFIHKCTQLWETITVRHSLMVVGTNMSGKSQTFDVLADSLKAVADGDLFKAVQMHKMNPKSVKMGELYGDFDENTHEWTDGLIAIYYRFCAMAGLEKRQWIILDGPVDAVWIENMNTVMDDNKKLCLASGEIIKMTAVTTMMMEVEDLSYASPATISRNGMVYMEQVDIGWDVILDSWCQILPDRLQDYVPQIKTLFNQNVEPLFEFNQRKVNTPVPLTKHWVVTNLLHLYWSLLQQDLPLEEQDEMGKEIKDIPAKEKDLKIDLDFWLAVVWSCAANTDSDGRHTMDQFIKDLMAAEPVQEKYDLIVHDYAGRMPAKCLVPDGGSIYDYYPNMGSNKLELWTKKIVGFDIPKNAEVHTIMVPTADTVRSAFLLQTLTAAKYHTLFTGLTGTGKTLVIQKELLNNFDKDKFTNISFAFSAQTTSIQTQMIIDGKLDKRKKGTYGPPLGKRCLVFVDDLNMPTKEIYGAQPPIELLRQWMDESGWYERKGGEWRNLVDLTFIGAMGPPGAGRPYLTGRYQRHYNLIMVTPFEHESLSRIFDNIMTWFLGKFSGAVAGLAKNAVKATIELYDMMAVDMRPTPAKSHYTFNLRDLSKVMQGVCLCKKDSLPGADAAVACWVHEAHRVFCDRLVSKEDLKWFAETIKGITKDNFKKDTKSLYKGDFLPVWCDFIDVKTPYYQEVQDPVALVSKINEVLADYNMMAKRGMDLVIFLSAAEHVCRIARVLKTPLGNVLLVGVGGSGRKSLATLGVFVSEQDLFTIELTKSYGMNEWHDDIKKLLIDSGGKNKEMSFLFADTQIANENFVEEVSGLLNTGEVPNLFNSEDKTQINELCVKEAEQKGKHGPNEVFAYFIEICRKNLHIVLALSPVGDGFRRRVRMFPSLVNCCTIDWFHEWPDEALQSVANYFLQYLEMTDDVRAGVVDICVNMQKSVFALTERFEKEVQRHYYVTPTSYLELINSFKDLLSQKREEVSLGKSRYDNGLDKIITTETQVTTMQAELEELKPFLKKTAEETAQLMVVIEKEQKDAAKTEALVSADEAVANAQAESANAMKADCQKDLDKAMPALESAVQALNSLKKSDIVEVKAMGKPPDGVVLVSKALCWAFNVAPKKVNGPDGRTKVDDYWEPAKKVIWGDPKLLDRLLEYDKDNIPPATMAKLKPLEEDPAFEPDAIKKASVAACGICKWVRAMIVYDQVAKVVGPKKESLAQAEGDLAAAMESLGVKKAELKAVQDKVAKLLADLAAATKKKQDLQDEYELCSKRLVTAEKLINGLGGEKARWTASSNVLGEQYICLTGDVLIASGVIAYLGCFLSQYRQESVTDWIGLMKKFKTPASAEFSLQTVIGDQVKIRQWVIDKLPNDPFSIDNALILSNSRRWPLMIDPQLQANKWIRNSWSSNLSVLRLTTVNYARKLEILIANGDSCLLENVGITIDPMLDPLLQKAIFKAGNIMMIRLGDSTVEYHKDFKLFLTTKLPNPHYAPEVCVQITLLNFMVTQSGLQDQMLGILVSKEEPEVEKKRVNLVIESAQSKAQLKEIEDKILQMLSESQGNILDDVDLIETLANSKVTSLKIEERVKEQEKTAELVAKTRETYVPVANRSSNMFFVIADLNICESTYQYSLEWFLKIFLLSIKTAEKFERNIEKRLDALSKQFIKLLYEKVCDSLFETDKLMFSFLLALKSMEVDHTLDQVAKGLLMVGGLTGAKIRDKPPAVQAAGWLTDVSWQRVSEATDLNHGPWIGFADKFAEHIDGWKAVFDAEDPVAVDWPCGFKQSMTPLEKAILLLAVRADSTVRAVQEQIEKVLGKDFLEPPPSNLEGNFNDSDPGMPIIYVLSAGADPMADILRLAAKVEMTERKAAVSLGQGQGPKAEAAVAEGKSRGMWVILQNCHLSVSWMPKLEAIVEDIDPDVVDSAFRLWLTTMPSNDFPVSVLQNGMKLTIEAPKGLKFNLLQAYLGVEQEWFDEAGAVHPNNPKMCTHAFRKMLFGLCFFHASIQERCQFGALGWNIPYSFSEQDRDISKSQLRIFLESNVEIPYDALQYTASECNYGGRVTDTHDRRLISFIITDFYCSDILQDSYKYSESGIYYSPKQGDLSSYIDYIKSLPINQAPEAFGLHANANLSARIKETMGLLSRANAMMPKGAGGEGGKTTDEVLSEMSAKFLEEIRPPFDMEAVTARFPVDYHESMNTVVNQEMLRFNKLISLARASLIDVGKAVKGLVVMDFNLEQVADGILRNIRPAYWMKVSYPSLKPLSSYVADLQARLDFLTDWEHNGHPATYWVSGFYFTQSYVTGQLQNFARKYTMAIDTLIWTFEVLEAGKTDYGQPENGCIVYGLFIEGSRWCADGRCLAESFPKVLFEPVPYMLWKPCEYDKDPTNYERVCATPLYKTSERKGTLSTTGHSTNFVTLLYLNMAPHHIDKHWIKRGVACFTQLDD
jgi:dynein heavy chain